jgi:hypothetical protein
MPPVLVGCTRESGWAPIISTGAIAQADLTCEAPGSTALSLAPGSMFFVSRTPSEPAILIDATMACYFPQHGGPSLIDGDANCDSLANSVDAAVILQYDAGLLDGFTCLGNLDLNGDGMTNSVDASIILQMDAGLIEAA